MRQRALYSAALLLLVTSITAVGCSSPIEAPNIREASLYFNTSAGDQLIYEIDENATSQRFEVTFRALGEMQRSGHTALTFNVVPSAIFADTIYYRVDGPRIYRDRLLGQEELFADLSINVTPDYNDNVLHFAREIGDTTINGIALEGCILLQSGWKYRTQVILAPDIGIVEYLPPSGAQQRLKAGVVRGRVFP